MKPTKLHCGYTIVELMVVIAVAAILLAAAAPSFVSFITSTRLTSQANDLVADIRFARSAAGTRGVRVVLCPTLDKAACSGSASDWAKGRLVFVDANGNGSPDAGEIVKYTEPLAGNSSISATGFNDTTAITFNPYGGVLPLGSTGSFLLCPPSSSAGRSVNVGISGRPSATKVTCH
jgi:type IV fimbrial biogenesis protein FimT